MNIDILCEEKKWHKAITQKEIKEITLRLYREILAKNLADNNKEISVSILLTNSTKIQELNKNYRQKDKPTNVLSFPIEYPKFLENEDGFNEKNLGDIVLCYEVIKNESAKQKKKFSNHLTHLILHSLLHLLGFDHINDKEAEIMENVEIEILSNLGINNPYYFLKIF